MARLQLCEGYTGCRISLNMPNYPWQCLTKLFWICQCSEYAWSSYMFDRLLKMPWVLNMPRFWIWHRCICKGYSEFWICLIMAPDISIMPKHALRFSVCLNIAEYCWMSLNMSENAWIKFSDYAGVLNMPQLQLMLLC